MHDAGVAGGVQEGAAGLAHLDLLRAHLLLLHSRHRLALLQRIGRAAVDHLAGEGERVGTDSRHIRLSEYALYAFLVIRIADVFTACGVPL